MKPSGACSGAVLQGAHGRSARSDNATAVIARRIDRFRAFCRNLIAFAVQYDLCGICHAHRLKCTEADVKRYGADCCARCPDLLEHLRRKVQSCRRRCRRAALPRVNRLISLTIECPVIAMDVWRQRHMSECIEAAVEIRHWRKAQRPLTAFSSGHNLRMKSGIVAATKLNAVPYPQLASRLHQRVPLPRVDLVPSATLRCDPLQPRSLRATSSRAKQARRNDTRIVQHQNVASTKLLRKLREDIVFPCARRPVEQEHPRSPTILRRLLRNQFFGQCEVELRNQH